MKRGLVFGGGGAKGAYEIGVWKALRELNISIDAVCGTSIGALNGCLFAQNDYEKALSIWEHLKPETVIEQGINLDMDFELLMSQKEQIDHFLETVIKDKRVDVSPFKELIATSLNEEKLYNSNIDFGLCTLNISKRTPVLITKEEMKDGNVAEYLYASAACFPVFPFGEINGDKYVDGGYYDNLPIQLAAKMGCDSFIAVSLNQKEIDEEHLSFKNLIVIQPYHSITSFLNFSEAASLANIQMGYLDCMKRFKRYKGFSYTFYSETIQQNIRLFSEFRKKYTETFSKTNQFISQKQKPIASYKKYFRNYFYNYDYISLVDIVIRCVELVGEVFMFDYTQIYNFNEFIEMLLATFDEYEKYFDKNFEKETLFEKNISNVYDLLSLVNQQMVIVFLYKLLLHEKGRMNPLLHAWNFVHEREVLCAFFLYYLKTDSFWDREGNLIKYQ